MAPLFGRTNLTSPALLFLLLAGPGAVSAADLREASVHQIVNEVKVIDPRLGGRPAVLKETIKDDLGIATGPQSRAELLFQDNTLTRLGAETFFHFKPGTRDLTLDRGTMLLQVPKGRGGARIRTGSVTASITGTTIMLEHLPKKQVRVLVLEGSLRLSLNDRPGATRDLTAGRMVTFDPHSKGLPEAVSVDLRKVVNYSKLVDPRAFKGTSKSNPRPLPSLGLIRKEISRQDHQISRQPAATPDGRAHAHLVAGSDSPLTTGRTATTAQEATVAAAAANLPEDSVRSAGPLLVRGDKARLIFGGQLNGDDSGKDDGGRADDESGNGKGKAKDRQDKDHRRDDHKGKGGKGKDGG
jgi:hypothetical protein